MASAILFMASDLSSGITGQTPGRQLRGVQGLMSARTDVGTVEDLKASATKAVGLDDFGTDDDNYLEALAFCWSPTAVTPISPRLGSKMSRFFAAQRAGGPAAERGILEAVPAARRRRGRAADLRHRAAAHRYHGSAPPAVRRSATPGSGTVAGGVPAAPAAPGNLAGQPGFRPARRAVQEGARREPRLHRPALHDRRRGGGVLAAAAPVAALGVLRDPGARAHLFAVAGRGRTGPSRTSGTARIFS